jgi:RNA polymerase sigma-70 factor (ECF subfamily)
MTISLNDDETLAWQARVDGNAFAELYRRYATRVYRYHLIRTGNVKDAEDLTSQTFLAALGALKHYRRDGSFAAWLMGIARRQAALFFRRRKPETFLENIGDLPAPFPATELQVSRRISFQQAYAGLQKISSERAEAIVLSVFGGLSLAETAQVLGKSVAAVKMLISRGLEDLRTRTLLALEVEA